MALVIFCKHKYNGTHHLNLLDHISHKDIKENSVTKCNERDMANLGRSKIRMGISHWVHQKCHLLCSNPTLHNQLFRIVILSLKDLNAQASYEA